MSERGILIELFEKLLKKNEPSSDGDKADKRWRYCPFCGKKIENEWKVCPACKNELSHPVESAEKPKPQTNPQEPVKTPVAENITIKNTIAGYECSEKIRRGSVLPEKVKNKLPDREQVVIQGFSDESKTFGNDYLMFDLDKDFESKSFIHYVCKMIPKQSLKERNMKKKRLYADSFHPFFSRFTKDVPSCIENMLKNSSSLPMNYKLYEDALFVCLDSGYQYSYYGETSNYFCYSNHYQESYHDGGGSGSTKWYIYAAESAVCKAELTEEICYKEFTELPGFVHLPYCRGFWTEDGHVYLVNPWGLPGVFEYYCHAEETWDYDSDTEIWDIGVPCELKY